MTLTLTDEQEQLRATVRQLLTNKAPSEQKRQWMDSDEGYDQELWRQMAEQLGLHGLAISEEYGGSGFGLSELAVVLEETGRSLLPSPFFSTVALAGQILLASADDAACRQWLPRIASGALTATVAICDEPGSWDLTDIVTTAEPGPGGWTVSGTKMFVTDGDSADLLLVIARTAEGLGLFAVDGSGSGVRRVRLDALDPTRRLGRVDLDTAAAQRIGGPTDATVFLRRGLDSALVALAAEQVGGAQACLEAAVAYAKARVQFDRPIGSFQAIKHKCADILLEVESAKAAVRYAASRALDHDTGADDDEFSICAATAAAYCSRAYTRAAKENIQIHGGIGFTWEHDAHLYLKRAKSSELLFGPPQFHRSRVADLVGI